MRWLLLHQKEKLAALLGAGLLVSVNAFAQDASSAGAGSLPPDGYVPPPPRTITAEIPPAPPERVVELYSHDDKNRVCIDTYRLSLSKTSVVRNVPVSARMRISRKCDDKAMNTPVPVSAVMSTRTGQKSGPSETITPDSGSFAFNITFPNAGKWTVTVVSKYQNGQTHTVSLPVQVLAE